MKAVETKKKKKFSLTATLVKGFCLFLLVSMIVGVVGNQLEIAEQKHALEQLTAQLQAQQADNDELALLMEAGETEVVERVAREEYGYAAPNERVFVDMSGK